MFSIKLNLLATKVLKISSIKLYKEIYSFSPTSNLMKLYIVESMNITTRRENKIKLNKKNNHFFLK